MMRMVERAKAGWLGWVISGIPVALAICALIFTSGVRLNSIDNKLDSLAADAKLRDARMDSLQIQVQSLQLTVQELKDELQYEKKINELQTPKRRVNYPQDSDRISNIPYLPPR